MKARPAGTLKAAAAELIQAAGGLARAADLIGRSTTQVHRMTDADAPDQHLNVDQVRRLERDAGRPVVTGFLIRELGWEAIPVLAGAGGAIDRGFAELGREASDLFARYAEALAGDGRVDAREAGRLIAETDELMAVLARLRSALTEIREDGR